MRILQVTLVVLSHFCSTLSAQNQGGKLPRPPCYADGLQFAVFNNTQGLWDAQRYPSFDPVYMKNISAGGQGASNLIYSSTTTKVGGLSTYCTGNFSAYGGAEVIPCGLHSFMYRGYLYPSVTGVYTFSLSDVDDIGLLWIGPSAQSGWNRGNALLESVWGNPYPGQTGTPDGNNATLLWLNASSYYPMRIVHANGGGWFNYWLSIVDPYGNTVLGANTSASPNVVQYSCNSNRASQYSSWGQEV